MGWDVIRACAPVTGCRQNCVAGIHVRMAINDPHQCRLCLRVCDDTFLESIFSEKEYSIAHQIFECTSIRVTKQDNLTKICRNCAALLFITTEFRNACFKTNRLLMEDFVILEVGEWVDDGNRTALASCSQLIVKHKQQVDYLYDSIVPDSESYLAGSLEIERELFNSATSGGEPKDQKEKDGGEDLGEMEAEEPDPEIIQEITKFLEAQQTIGEEGMCQICTLDVGKKVSEDSAADFVKYFQDKRTAWICDMCQQCLAIVTVWHGLFRNGRSKTIRSTRHKLSSIKETQRHLLKQFQDLKRQLEKAERPKPKPAQVKVTKRKTVECSQCGKRYDSWKMKAHLNEHEQKKPYKCDQAGCSSAFAGVDLLNRHRKLWHTDYFYKSCSTCGKKCKTQGIYKTHISYHEDPQLPCEICGKLMRNKRSMWKHMKSHQKPEQREHVCEVCNKRFAVAYTLRVHRRIHTNEKPFPCNLCGKQFQYNCLLKNHVDRYHKVQ